MPVQAGYFSSRLLSTIGSSDISLRLEVKPTAPAWKAPKARSLFLAFRLGCRIQRALDERRSLFSSRALLPYNSCETLRAFSFAAPALGKDLQPARVKVACTRTHTRSSRTTSSGISLCFSCPSFDYYAEWSAMRSCDHHTVLAIFLSSGCTTRYVSSYRTCFRLL